MKTIDRVVVPYFRGGSMFTCAGVNDVMWRAVRELVDGDVQNAMNQFVVAVLAWKPVGGVDLHENYRMIRSVLGAFANKGGVFPTEMLFEFSGGCVAECARDFPARAMLMFASGNDLNWSRDVEGVCVKDVVDEAPTKEVLTQCLKRVVDDYSYMLLW